MVQWVTSKTMVEFSATWLRKKCVIRLRPDPFLHNKITTPLRTNLYVYILCIIIYVQHKIMYTIHTFYNLYKHALKPVAYIWGGVLGVQPPPPKFMVSTTHVCISLIYVLIKTKLSSMGKKCSLLIFKQIIRPILTYACPVWGNCASSHIKKMQIVQNKVLRII
jgi:hypothetical protein